MRKETLSIALFAVFLPSAVSADWNEPQMKRVDGYFNVFGVRDDDVLNIRDKPSGTALKIGYFSYDAVLIEIIKTTPNGKWGYVKASGGIMGWISMRYLTPATLETYGNTEIPIGLNCITTEPHITYTLVEDKIIIQNFSLDKEYIYNIGNIRRERDGHYYIDHNGDGFYVDTLVIANDSKGSDGMSDVEYKWSVWDDDGWIIGGCFFSNHADTLPIKNQTPDS